MGCIYRPKYTDRHGKERESAIFWVAYYVNGRLIRESSLTADYEKAKNFLKGKEGDAAHGLPVSAGPGRIRFDEIMADVVVDYEINNKGSVQDLKRRNKLHLAPFFGRKRAAGITTADFRRYILARQNEGAQNATINRELAAVKRAYSLAVKEGKLAFRPHIPMLQENNVRKGFFEPGQLDAILPHIKNDDVRACLRFAYITGWRLQSEVLPLQWSQVDFNAETVRLEPGTTKNDEARTFPFTAELRLLLEAQRAKKLRGQKRGRICPWVFSRNGRRIKSIKNAWHEATTAAGLPGRIPHDFRRTAVRNFVRAGIPDKVAMQLSGHKTRSVFERYNIVSSDDLKDAARRLDAAEYSKKHSKTAENGK